MKEIFKRIGTAFKTIGHFLTALDYVALSVLLITVTFAIPYSLILNYTDVKHPLMVALVLFVLVTLIACIIIFNKRKKNI